MDQAKTHNPSRDFFSSATSLRKMEKAYHEFVGLIWAKIRNQI
jgi:hypothetical protein